MIKIKDVTDKAAPVAKSVVYDNKTIGLAKRPDSELWDVFLIPFNSVSKETGPFEHLRTEESHSAASEAFKIEVMRQRVLLPPVNKELINE
jgi:hypothetical protein